MRVKDGAHHITSLRDGREVWLRGARVSDVTTHPAYRGAVASAASLYDFQAAPANVERMTIALPNGACRVNRAWQLPRSYAELVERRRALEAWAAVHYGFMGRSPDHVASTLAGMAPTSFAPMRDLINKTQKSPAVAPEERVKLFKLAWDAVGSEFGSRHAQYEMFYAGAPFVTKGHAFRTYDWASATGMVDRLMAEYDLDAELARLSNTASRP